MGVSSDYYKQNKNQNFDPLDFKSDKIELFSEYNF